MATSHAHKSQEYVIFIGNPGVGKSTLLNSVLGEARFQSGLSYGGGLTRHLQWASRDDVIYGDTPGLADSEPNMRQQAAREIRESLKENGNYKILFVVTLEAGRVRADDAATIKIVLEAVDDDAVPFAIVVNKASSRLLDELARDAEMARDLLAGLCCGRGVTPFVFFYPYLDDLVDKDNAVVKTNEKFVAFITGLPSTFISADSVRDLAANTYERTKADLETRLVAMRSDHALRQEALQRVDDVREKFRTVIMHLLEKGVDMLILYAFGTSLPAIANHPATAAAVAAAAATVTGTP